MSGSWLAAGTGVDRRSTFRLDYPAAVAELSCGFDRNGANRLLVEGERGGVILEAPFLKARRLSWYADAGRAAAAYERGTGGMVRLLDRLPQSGRISENLAFAGNGLQFQAEAAMTAIRAGQSACAEMPLGDSAAVLKIIETIRAQPAAAS